MITLILFGLTVIILLLQFFIMPKASQHLLLHYSFDTHLAEPVEKIVFSGRLSNNWFLPVTYINFFELMPEGAVISGKESSSSANESAKRNSEHNKTIRIMIPLLFVIFFITTTSVF